MSLAAELPRVETRIRKPCSTATSASLAAPVARRKAAPSRRNRSYFAPEKMRAAFLAGQGKNCGEIATELGGTTPRKVRDMLRSCGIKVVRPVGRPRALLVYLTMDDQQRLEEFAAERDADPADLARELLRVVMLEPVVAANLLDEEGD